MTAEQTIGILKGRFCFLRGIPMKITDDKNSMKRILRYIDCCMILHNLLLDVDDEIPDEWIDDVDDCSSQIGESIGEVDYSFPLLNDEINDERRQRCLQIFRDYRIV